jgi:essential nuclear protein 1
MGKAKKLKLGKTPRNLPLRDQIEKDDFAVSKDRVKERRNRDLEDDFVEGKLSKQILVQARNQLREIEDEVEGDEDERAVLPKPKKVTLTTGSKHEATSDEEDDADEEETDDLRDYDGSDLTTELRIRPQDEQAFELFMNRDAAPRRTLADLIHDKITEKRTEIDTQFSDAESLQRKQLDPRVVEMYEGVGKVLARYRSGKVPKAFKVIPQFRNWEDLLVITEPDRWSAAAVFVASRIFVSGLQAKMAQRFFNQYLLPRVRDDIDTYQRLNFHLYQALRKALFKPDAFFKGFLLPLCESGTCTLREAIIIGSVLAKNSIPILHSCAVMIKIAEMEYSGANSIFLRILLDKKYALPFRVVDAIVFHFLKFRSEKRELPVLWHQAFLTFVQRYKAHVSSEQRDALLDILRFHVHHKITPEIRRELANAKCRDMQTEEPMAEERYFD